LTSRLTSLVLSSVRFAEVVAGLEATTGDTVTGADLARASPLTNARDRLRNTA
jgi:hypothetical protein